MPDKNLVDENKLTPTESLIIEVLTARYRMGENSWTFSANVNKSLISLEEKGWVGWKHAPIEGASLAWFTREAKGAIFARKYEPFGGWVSLKKRSKQLRKEAKRIVKSSAPETSE